MLQLGRLIVPALTSRAAPLQRVRNLGSVLERLHTAFSPPAAALDIGTLPSETLPYWQGQLGPGSCFWLHAIMP